MGTVTCRKGLAPQLDDDTAQFCVENMLSRGCAVLINPDRRPDDPAPLGSGLAHLDTGAVLRSAMSETDGWLLYESPADVHPTVRTIRRLDAYGPRRRVPLGRKHHQQAHHFRRPSRRQPGRLKSPHTLSDGCAGPARRAACCLGGYKSPESTPSSCRAGLWWIPICWKRQHRHYSGIWVQGSTTPSSQVHPKTHRNNPRR